MQKKNSNNFVVLLAIAAFYGVLHLLGITCPIRFFTGISCPGCGMTRAWLSLLRGDYHQAFDYHPLFILPLIFVICYLFRSHLSVKMKNVLLYSGIGLFLIVYMIRMFDPKDRIVVFQPENGILIKTVLRLFQQ